MNPGACSGLCGAQSKDRPVWESPAKFGRLPDGTRIVYCPCCLQALTPAPDNAAAPNVDTAIAPRQRRFEDVICGYDVVVVKELATG